MSWNNFVRWVLEKSIECLWSVLASVLEAEDKKEKYQIFLGEVCGQLESLKKNPLGDADTWMKS